MKNNKKTTEQLLNEISKLNDKIDELEKSKNERNRPIDTMQESEQKFKALVESARDGIIVIQNDVIKFANPHVCEIYGASLSNVIGQSFLKFVHPDSVEMIKKRYANWRSGKKVPNFFKVDLINSNREKRICEINSSTIVFDGQPSELVIIHDITEHKKAEEAIRESEEKYRTIFENTGTATIIIEENMIISVANAKFLDLTGYSREEIEGQKSWTEFVIPEDLERMKKQHKLRRKNSNAALINYEFKMINRNNEIKDIFLTIDMIPGTKKSVASLLDITEHKQAEEALQESEEKFRNFVETSADLVFRLTKTGRIDYVSSRVEDLYGYQPDELIGKHLRTTTPVGEVTKAIKGINVLLTGKPIKNFEINQKTKAGQIIPMEINAVPVYQSGKIVGFQGIMRDITERKQVEEKLKSRNTELETWAEVTTGRELFMLKLKKEINELLEKSGEKPKYEIPI